MRIFTRWIIPSLAVLALAAPLSAQAACVSACGSMAANGDVTAPPTSSTYGYVSTWGGVDGAGQLPMIGGTDGSMFTTAAFSAGEGETLRYDFNFITSDGQSGPGQFIYEDYAFVQLLDAATGQSVAMLFNARTEPDVLAVPGCGYTGWIRSEYQVQQAGQYRLAFGVSNWGDNIYDTGLAYSGIRIGEREIEDHEGVPEPAAWALMILGLGAAGAQLRHRRLATAARRRG